MGRRRSTYGIVVRKSSAKHPCGTLRRDVRIVLEKNLREIGHGCGSGWNWFRVVSIDLL
jgi:hypothetical protein